MSAHATIAVNLLASVQTPANVRHARSRTAECGVGENSLDFFSGLKFND